MSNILNRIFSYFGLFISRSKTVNHEILRRQAEKKESFDQLIKLSYEIFLRKEFPNMPNLLNQEEIKLISELVGTSIHEGFYIIVLFSRTMGIDGDVCEFGVAQGRTSTLLAYLVSQTEKELWLFDSFQGLPEPSDKDILLDDIFDLGSIEKYKGEMSFSKHVVINNIRSHGFNLNKVKIVQGFIERTFSEIPESISFAYVDFDFYEPIMITLEELHKRLSPGGIIVVDDYDFFSTGSKTAVDQFMHEYQDFYKLEMPDKMYGCFCFLTRIG